MAVIATLAISGPAAPGGTAFTAVTDAPRSARIASNERTVSGLSGPVYMAVVGGEIVVNNRPYTSGFVTVENGDTYKVRCWSSDAQNTETTATVYILGVSSHAFSVTTNAAADITLSGMKSLQATGSISAGSNVLTLTSNPGFVIGNSIIVVPTTGRGTKGPGGQWPLLTFADTTAMNANTSQADAKVAWVEASGSLYWWNDATAGRTGNTIDGVPYVADTWVPFSPNWDYYRQKAVPFALKATITNVSGNVLTLDKVATNAVSGATVRFDNKPIWEAALGEGVSVAAGTTVNIPAGDFAFSARAMTGAHERIVVQGASLTESVLFSPSGTQDMLVYVGSCANCTFRDFGLLGNALFDGYCMQFSGASFTGDAVSEYGRGVLLNACTDTIVERVRTDDTFMAVVSRFGTNCSAISCEAYHSVGLKNYIQWMFQFADGVGNFIVDCRVDSAKIMAGFELFREEGGGIIRPIGRNAGLSMNTAGGWIIDSPVLVFEANSQLDAPQNYSWNVLSPVIQTNKNIDPNSPLNLLGGTIRNPTITFKGPINDGTGPTARNCPPAIITNSPNITIEGTYPDGFNPKGLITFEGGGYNPSHRGAQAMVTGDSCDIRGIRFVGTTTPGVPTIANESASVISITDCIMDAAPAAGATVVVSNVQTNAAWLASHP